jgi:hypothetical protein
MWTLAEASFWTKQGLWPVAGNFLAVEDVFSTYLYTGTGAAQTITNGINLSGQGGMVWIKSRSAATSNFLFDTTRGVNVEINSNTTDANATLANSLTAFNSNGFSISSAAGIGVNAATYASWTFREAPNFFDVVTYTGTGANRTIAHNLGVAPGMILVKRTNTTGDWQVYHRSNANTQYMVLNSTAAVATGATRWNSTTPTSTEFSVGTDATVNASGGTYVAYLFAHVTASDGIIQCGSYTGNGSSTGPIVTLGWEPQWILVKRSDSSANWFTIDNMRGWSASTLAAGTSYLSPNTTSAEDSAFSSFAGLSATGFQLSNSNANLNASGGTFIYMAIRRGPMRTPTLGTSVFYPQTVAQTATPDSSGVPFPPDLVNTFSRNGTNRTSEYDNFLFVDRLRSLGVPSDTYSGGTAGRALVSSSTGAELSASDSYVQLKANSQNITRGSSGWNSAQYGNWIYYFFRRAPGFFDVVCYTGTGVARTVAHNLGVAPELMIVKSRSGTFNWMVYSASLGNTKRLFLDLTNAESSSSPTNGSWNDTSPTSSVFSVGDIGAVNASAATFVAYLFASAPGVSKVGSYTGNGSSQTINCAFTTGARYVLIKRTDSTGDWYVWDSARGIVAGNDPYLALNSTAVEVTSDDSVDTDNTGFIVNQVAASNINVNAATYIFLAIA